MTLDELTECIARILDRDGRISYDETHELARSIAIGIDREESADVEVHTNADGTKSIGQVLTLDGYTVYLKRDIADVSDELLLPVGYDGELPLTNLPKLLAILNHIARNSIRSDHADPDPTPTPQRDDRPRRIVHSLGEDERNGLWACTEPPTWQAFYSWQNRNPALHHGDNSPAWHYCPEHRAERGYWSMARSGTEDTTAKTIGPLGDIERATFVELARLQPDGTLTYFGNDGSQWQLSAGPMLAEWLQTDGS